MSQGQFNAIGNCDINALDIIIQNGEDIIWTTRRHLRSNVLVEDGGKLTIRCDLGMPEGSNITVEAGGQLIVDGARIYPNCDGFWEGIIVYGNGDGWPQAYDWSNNETYVGRVTLEDATIEQAVIGVRAGSLNNQQPYLNGGYVRARNSRFLNCSQHGVLFEPFQNTTLTGQPTGNLSSFSNCDFVNDAGNPSGLERFHSMAMLRHVDGIPFIFCRFLNDFPMEQEYSDDRRYGIYATGSGFSVSGRCLTSDRPCPSFANGLFSGFFQAIHADQSRSARTISVTNTTFTNNHAGISATGMPNSFIVNNDFEVGSELKAKPHPNPNLSEAHVGLELIFCSGYQVEGNRFTRFASPQATNPTGTRISGSGRDANEVYRNEFEGLDIANFATGLNRGDFPFGLQYLCNEHIDNEFDLNASTYGQGAYGIARFQGSGKSPAGNTFSNNGVHINDDDHPIEYFFAAGQPNEEPLNITGSQTVNPISVTQANSCLSRVPERREKGELTEEEKEDYKQKYSNSEEEEVRTSSADMLVRHYMLDSIEQDPDSVRIWLANKDGLAADFTIVDTYLQEGDFTAAEQSLAVLAETSEPGNAANPEIDLFVELKSLQLAALQDGVTDEGFANGNTTALAAIAGAGNGHASAQAQAVLNSLSGEVPPPWVTLPTPGGNGQGGGPPIDPPGNNGNNNNGGQSVSAVPNPANAATVFHYSTGTTEGECKITVRSAQNVVVWQAVVEPGSGTVNWAFGQSIEGLYFYSLEVDGVAVLTEQLVIF